MTAALVKCAIGPGKRPGYVEVHFEVKPADEVRAELKAAGFRWAKSGGCWYGLVSRLPERYMGAPLTAEDVRDPSWKALPEDRDELRDPGEDAADRWNEVNR